jgi:hypothetical protein
MNGLPATFFNQGVFKDFSVFKGFSSALEYEFKIPGVFKEWHKPCLNSTNLY